MPQVRAGRVLDAPLNFSCEPGPGFPLPRPATKDQRTNVGKIRAFEGMWDPGVGFASEFHIKPPQRIGRPWGNASWRPRGKFLPPVCHRSKLNRRIPLGKSDVRSALVRWSVGPWWLDEGMALQARTGPQDNLLARLAAWDKVVTPKVPPPPWNPLLRPGSFGQPGGWFTSFRCFHWAQNDMHKSGRGLVSGWMGSPGCLEFHLREGTVAAEVAPCT